MFGGFLQMLKKRKEVRKTNHQHHHQLLWITILLSLFNFVFILIFPVNSFDWVCWMCCTWSNSNFNLFLTDQTGCHFKQDQKPRAMGDIRSIKTTEAHDH